MPRLRQFLTAACAVTVALNMTQCTQAPPLEQCVSDTPSEVSPDTASAVSPDTRISECTAAIESGNASTADLATALMYRGIAYREKGALDSAIQDYDRAIRLKPDYAYAFLNRGAAYDDRGEHDRAIQDYEQAMRFKPGFAVAFLNRGLAYADKSDYERAIQD